MFSERELELLDNYQDEERVLRLAATDREREQWRALFAIRRKHREEHEARLRRARPIDIGAEVFRARTSNLMRQRHGVAG